MKNNEVKTAGYMLRLIAKAIDILIVWLPILLIIKYFSVVTTFSSFINTIISLLIGVFLLYFVAIFYNVYLTSLIGGTFGKRLVGLIVINEKGMFLSLKESFFRYTVGYFISNIFFGFGYFWIIKDKNNQGWHDQISGTYVIQRNTSELSVMMSLTIVLFLIVFYGTIAYSV